MFFPETFYTIDILFVVFVLLFTFSGTKTGLAGELAHVMTLLALLAGVCFFYPQLIDLASNYWRALPPTAVKIIVPAGMLLTAVLLFVLVRLLIKQLLKDKLGEAADKVAGGLVGTLRGVLFGMAVFTGISLIPNDSLYQTLSEKSSIGGWVCNTLTPWSQSHLKELPVLKDNVSDRLDDITQ
ncbi:MAG: CvpA family protein [Kiritimatiellaceae bacterium]|nr:CvpA family protein [Kiritimatiellaceae bacterium]